ncbi:hypothetical protein [Curvivirga aplysinae]|uniref:hypothetical protein n=1 Tax=Curvivirga aplysinae TaxID=2529852 RepID=UPI0012BD6226|nr:hypothetical protein [Curvivirga aplysinae]
MQLSKSALKGIIVLSLCLNFFFLGKFGSMTFFGDHTEISEQNKPDGRPMGPPPPPHKIVLRILEMAHPQLSPEGQRVVEDLALNVKEHFDTLKRHMRETRKRGLESLRAENFDLLEADEISADIVRYQKESFEVILDITTKHFAMLSHEDRMIIHELFARRQFAK